MEGGLVGRSGGGDGAGGKLWSRLSCLHSAGSVVSPCTTRWDRHKRPRAVWSSRLIVEDCPLGGFKQRLLAIQQLTRRLRRPEGSAGRCSGGRALRSSGLRATQRQDARNVHSGAQESDQDAAGNRQRASGFARQRRSARRRPTAHSDVWTCRLVQWAGGHVRSLLT